MYYTNKITQLYTRSPREFFGFLYLQIYISLDMSVFATVGIINEYIMRE